MWILACIPWGGMSGPPERGTGRGRPSPVQPAVLAQNSDSISDSDTMQLFVLQVLTLSHHRKKGGHNICYDQLYETVQKVIRRRRTTKAGRPALPITLVLNTLTYS